MMEAKLEGFATSEGLTNEQFQQKCIELSKDEGASHFIKALVASWDFDAFAGLARAYLAEQEEEAAGGGVRAGMRRLLLPRSDAPLCGCFDFPLRLACWLLQSTIITPSTPPDLKPTPAQSE